MPTEPATTLTTAQIGAAFFVFRLTEGVDKPERLPGVHKSMRAANTAARTISAQTGETIVK